MLVVNISEVIVKLLLLDDCIRGSCSKDNSEKLTVKQYDAGTLFSCSCIIYMLHLCFVTGSVSIHTEHDVSSGELRCVSKAANCTGEVVPYPPDSSSACCNRVNAFNGIQSVLVRCKMLKQSVLFMKEQEGRCCQWDSVLCFSLSFYIYFAFIVITLGTVLT